MIHQVKKSLFIYCSFLLLLACTGKNQTTNSMIETKSDTISVKVEKLLNEMTIEEKVGQMNLYNGFWDATGPMPQDDTSQLKYNHLKKGWVGAMLNVRGTKNVKAVQKIAVEESRLGIPLLIGFDVIHGYKTLSPIPIAEAASWDLEAIEKSARVAAIEASAAGINWTFAPMVDVSRDARWGRVMEGAGEDPFLGAQIAKARVKGFQGDDLSKDNTIAACAKHFAAYGFSEAGKEYNTVDIGLSTLYNTVLPPFKAALDAGVKTFMNSFNELNGVPVTGSNFLQREILKGNWNFNGFVVSDWASINELISWGHAKDKKEAAKTAAKAGSDMDMEGNVYIQELAELVKKSIVSEEIIDDAVRRILRVKFELGLFEDPYKYCNTENEKKQIGNSKHHEAVLDVAKKSIVLLKNEGNILPLKKEGQKIALIGPLANDKNSPLGSWRIASDDNTAVSVLEGLQKYKGNKLNFEKGIELVEGDVAFTQEVNINYTLNSNNLSKAIEIAKKSDVVIMVLGEHGFQSGEGRSRTDIGLPGLQQELLEKIYTVNKNIILVLNNGRPLAIEWATKNIPAIVEAWQLGTQTGNAVAEVLYGDYNPSGKLPMTFPRNIGQIPIYYNYKNTGRPTKEPHVFWSHYIDSENTPLYPFGYGLSYTKFEYKNLKINGETFSINDSIEITIDIENTGKFEGKEIIQLYIRDLYASITRPVKELKAFKSINLKPGEIKTIKFSLTKKDLGYYNNKGNFIIESGEFEIHIGTNSSDTIKKTIFLD